MPERCLQFPQQGPDHWYDIRVDIYVDAWTLLSVNREQLGGNKFLVSDGIFMAKALNRTFVEYPVRDSRYDTLDTLTC